MQSIDQLRSALESSGLNVWGVADGRAYTPWLEGCRSVVVVGNGGRQLWERYEDHVNAHPQVLRSDPHPFDSFVRASLVEAGVRSDGPRRWVLCASNVPTRLDFRTLAKDAGLGHPSRLGLLLHPEFGPWFGLRAACFTTEVIPPTPLTPAPGPCDGCPAPCATSCRGGVFGPDLNVGLCLQQRARDTHCAQLCDSRAACPSGAAHAYGEAQHRYHSAPVASRKAWAERLFGVTKP